jgi:predicted RNase H-like HicB family nuclease
MSERIYVVRADWDAEAKVWVAYSDDVPGLASGADTLEDLVEKLRVVVPELLDENGLLPVPSASDDVPFFLLAQRIEHARRVA